MNSPSRVVSIVPEVAVASLPSHDLPPRSLDEMPPCLLHVAGVDISEADIAHEMPYHPAADFSRARADAARALVVRELLRREVERLALTASPVDGETVEEAQIRTLMEQALQDPPAPSDAQCSRYYERHRGRLRTSAGQPVSFEQALSRIREYLAVQAHQHAVRRYLIRLAKRYPIQGLAEIEAQAR